MRKMMIAILAGLGIMTMSMNSAKAALEDDYKFMATLAAVAEMCYDSEEIPDTVNAAMSAAREEDSDLGPMFDQLLDIYNKAYYTAIVDSRIWIASHQAFSKSFNCSSKKDVKMIKEMEAKVLDLF